jgi:lysophospholipase L1-like esterase
MTVWSLNVCFVSMMVCVSALGQAPEIVRVDAPIRAVSLPIATHGRVQAAPSSAVAAFPMEYESQWPGVYFKTAFRGPTLYFRVGPAREILHIVVDGGKPLLLVEPQPGVYGLYHLQDAPHEVDVFVATEGHNVFGGFASPPGERALAVHEQTRQIEFIGDSHTVGYGNLSPKRECSSEEMFADTDNTQAFGALVAAHYGADYEVNAISGRGIVRNYNGGPGDTIPEAYPYVLSDKRTKFVDPGWNPQVIVIALGTNDFSTPLNAGERWKTRDELHADFEATYVAFLQSLQASHPRAAILLWATGLSDGEIESEARKVVQQATSKGVRRVSFVPVGSLAFSGCQWHPSVADDRMIASLLEKAIDAMPGVWGDR